MARVMLVKSKERPDSHSEDDGAGNGEGEGEDQDKGDGAGVGNSKDVEMGTVEAPLATAPIPTAAMTNTIEVTSPEGK